MPWTIDDHEASAVEAIERGVISGNPTHLAAVPEPVQSAEHQARVSSLSILNQIAGPDAVVETPWTAGAYPPVVTPPVDDRYTHIVEVAAGTTRLAITGDTLYVPAPGWDGVMVGGGLSAAVTGVPNHTALRGFTMTGYDPPTQAGVIHCTDGDDFVIEDCELHHNDEVGIKSRADRTVVRRCNVHHQGRLGLSIGNYADPTAVGSLVEDSELAFCNWEGVYSWGNEAGGTKFWQSTNLTVRRVYSHDHVGPGLWADKDNVNWQVYDNTIEDCATAPGIFQEIGGPCHIYDNTIRNCGDADAVWLWDAGILVSSSNDGVIRDNTIVGCGNGVGLVQQDRGSGAYGEHLLLDTEVFGNAVTDSRHSGVVRADQAYPDVFVRNSDWHDNVYTGEDRFAWENSWGNTDWWRTYHPEDAI